MSYNRHIVFVQATLFILFHAEPAGTEVVALKAGVIAMRNCRASAMHRVRRRGSFLNS